MILCYNPQNNHYLRCCVVTPKYFIVHFIYIGFLFFTGIRVQFSLMEQNCVGFKKSASSCKRNFIFFSTSRGDDSELILTLLIYDRGLVLIDMKTL